MPEMSPTRHWNIPKTPPKNQQTTPKQHGDIRKKRQRQDRDITETSPKQHRGPRHHWDTTETSWRHHRDITAKHYENSTETSPWHHWNNTETSPKHHRDIPETSAKHHENKTETSPWHPETSPKQSKTKTDTSRGQDRDTTESMNFSILKLSPSTYGSQLHWFAQRCTIYKFKSEFEILLRNPIKMFINVHHQTIKTPSPKKKNSTATSTRQHQAITHSPSKHHSTINTHHRDFTETCPRPHQHIKKLEASSEDIRATATLVCPKVHNIQIQIGIWDFAQKPDQNVHQCSSENQNTITKEIKTAPQHQRHNTKPSPTHHQNITAPSTHITEISPKHARDVTNTSKNLKHHPRTYEPQLHWFAQRCTIYKFKLEFEILLRNPIKMFINVHQKIKTPSPKK